MDPRRWTPFTFVTPERYVDRGEFWTEFDMEEWSRTTYEWIQDPWNGLWDFARRPRDTVEAGRGDCEDYALVAVSWLVAQDRNRVGLAFCWERPYPWARHVVAFDGERVYSSGSISQGSVEEWVERSRYAFSVSRRIR